MKKKKQPTIIYHLSVLSAKTNRWRDTFTKIDCNRIEILLKIYLVGFVIRLTAYICLKGQT